MKNVLTIKLKNETFETIDDIELIANNLEFLGFAIVINRFSNQRYIFTTNELISIEEHGF